MEIYPPKFYCTVQIMYQITICGVVTFPYFSPPSECTSRFGQVGSYICWLKIYRYWLLYIHLTGLPPTRSTLCPSTCTPLATLCVTSVAPHSSLYFQPLSFTCSPVCPLSCTTLCSFLCPFSWSQLAPICVYFSFATSSSSVCSFSCIPLTSLCVPPLASP